MKPELKKYTAEVGGKSIVFSTGRLAGQAGGAVTLQIDDMMLFCAATMASKPREGIDFFPLSVDFEEKMYAGGKIPGSFFRREGRPSTHAILNARLVDRPLRPLFPNDMRNDVQVLIYTYSYDGINPMDVQAINVASAAVSISNTPWDGPVGAVRIGYVNDKLVVNPTFQEMEVSKLDLRVAGTKEALLMVEAGAEEVSEELMTEALELAYESIQPIVATISQMQAEVGKEKSSYPSFAADESYVEIVKGKVTDKLNALLDQDLGKHDLYDGVDAIRDEMIAELGEDVEADVAKEYASAFEKVYKHVVRERILDKGHRPDGRKPNEIRPIWCDTGVSPLAHGCGLFTRGETQVMSMLTLGTPRDAQELDNLDPESKKRYIHHYNFPPFSVGEVRGLRGTSRREIGHGALAERALIPVIPTEEEFPYTVRVVSECLSSNGSTSMGSVCGSTLALMDAGVPIKKPVSGIAMGMVSDGDRYQILSDIQGLEDHLGDMDFKVTGTEDGITALQMDIKIDGLTTKMMSEALQQAKEGRAHILAEMLKELPSPRAELKNHVPRISTVTIPVAKIGAVIGPGGKMIRQIQEETNSVIEISEEGVVFIATSDGEGEQKARDMIKALTETAEIGRIYTGKVVRIADFGAFVEVLPGQDGMVHISQLDTSRVEKVTDICRMGDEITVMVTNIDNNGKIRLSRRAVLEGWTAEEAMANDNANKKRSSGGNRNSRGGDRRGGNNRSSNNRGGGGNNRNNNHRS